MLAFRKALGLAMTARSVAIAEVGFGRSRNRLIRTAEFAVPEAAADQNPAVLGKALRQFLRQQRFSASRCVIGLDARGFVAKEKILPPMPAEALAPALAIAAEREFTSDAEDLVCDYAGPLEGRQGTCVLLAAASRQTVERVVATAKAAGLSVAGVTSSTMALSLATQGAAAPGRMMLCASSDGAELALGSGHGFQMIRRLTASQPPSGHGWLDDVAAEIRRILALRPGGPETVPLREMLVWDGIGHDPAALKALGERLGLTLHLCRLRHDLGLDDGPDMLADGKFAAAAALALGARKRPSSAINFLHSRLAPRRRFVIKRKVAWAAMAAGVVLVAGLVLVLDWRKSRQDVVFLEGRLNGMQESVAAAQQVLDRASFARGWYDRRPRFLDGLRHLTLAFPVEGKIWATNLAVRDDTRVSLSGKAVDERAVLEVLDRLKGNPAFADVQPVYIRQAGGTAREVSFAVNLRFVGAD